MYKSETSTKYPKDYLRQLLSLTFHSIHGINLLIFYHYEWRKLLLGWSLLEVMIALPDIAKYMGYLKGKLCLTFIMITSFTRTSLLNANKRPRKYHTNAIYLSAKSANKTLKIVLNIQRFI